MSAKRLPKVLKFVTMIGLLPILLIGGVIALYLWMNNKANPINQAVLFLSPYRNLRKYIIAQAKLESADFTSNIYRKTNNPLGMGKAYKRKQLGELASSEVFEQGHTNPIQKYRNDTQGFRDLFLWFDYGNFPKSVGSLYEYVDELKKRRYFGAPVDAYAKGMGRYL